MKNLIIFVLTLVAISSVSSMKLNKVLKEEKILTVSKVNNEDQLYRGHNGAKKTETTNENYSLQDICKQAEEGFVGKKSELEVILSALNCPASASKIETSSEKMLQGSLEEDCKIARNSKSDDWLKEAILSALGCPK